MYIQLSGALSKGTERQIVDRVISDNLSFRGLFVFSDVEQKKLASCKPGLVNKTKEGKRGRLRLRRMTVGLEAFQRTAAKTSFTDIDLIGEDATAAQLQDIHDEA